MSELDLPIPEQRQIVKDEFLMKCGELAVAKQERHWVQAQIIGLQIDSLLDMENILSTVEPRNHHTPA